ncbi:type I polyketide synthase [Gloeobacter morelensis]|uniref:SDR family NAD(P)-dependent oxidoreductase n=1 Tax=Gloeobacter morelensis MG652769 TaxID=2781736 RepID=A0ABY3PRT3_9CYAN|nr:type I polyketide synthase [Gloeobacter morelensis]UFP96312.1 SDR family NAD(P)-dependent oxidoreductase [Gloeobacter morelensis MG652769]
MTHAVAIVGMACQYPDAGSPAELWQNVLAQRRAFRQFPAERLNLDDYQSDDRTAPDRTYGREAALIEGYEFDRVRFRVGGNAYRSADLTHWLALDIAERALCDAGFPGGAGLPLAATGVLLGNTLTGEFSRANIMRLRWPYVRRVAEAVLDEAGIGESGRRELVTKLGERFKAPFAPIGEDSLAGGLANTIAGRICNYFDFKGGGYTVDGACSSSLLAIASACTSLVAGDLDVAIAGGVDLSLDPFEMVGFSKAGALSAEDMRIYDSRPAGFLPGEGCGMLVLMRHTDAVIENRRIYAVVRGWGVSSDGSGGLTRPEVEGQLLALRRAYRHTGFGPESVGYFEGHGTGTAVGDECELRVLSRARREADPQAPPVAVGSIKAIIGHTKAAAGVAGLIKAAMAVHTGIVPPTTGCEAPHKQLTEQTPALRALKAGEAWPAGVPLRSAVSSMGFGGINAHIVMEGDPAGSRPLTHAQRTLLRSAQDAELLLIDAEDGRALLAKVEHLLALAAGLSRSDLTDLAARLAADLEGRPWRAAIVAVRPLDLHTRLQQLQAWLLAGETRRIEPAGGLFLASGRTRPRIGFLFPGQGAPPHLDGGIWARRFEAVQALYGRANLPATVTGAATAIVQPAIVTAALAGLGVLERLGVRAEIAAGHSLGELAALHWSGALGAEAAIALAAARGRAMGGGSGPTGTMASIRATPAQVTELIENETVVIAGLNAPCQTVISGPAAAVAAVIDRCGERGIEAVQIRVSHAFHSPLVAQAANALAAHLQHVRFDRPNRPVASTLTGALLDPQTELRAHLVRQVTGPVRFVEAARTVAAGADLLIEVGPGRILSGLAGEFLPVPAIPLDAGGPSLVGLLAAVGAAFALGVPVDAQALFADRFSRPFALDRQPRFFVNPCELAPKSQMAFTEASAPTAEEPPATPMAPSVETVATLALVRALVAEKSELPPEAVEPEHRLLSDLHLNSITVSQLVADAARRMGLTPPTAPGDYADATVAALAAALDELALGGPKAEVSQRPPDGIDVWIRGFGIELCERSLPPVSMPEVPSGLWKRIAPPAHPIAGALAAGLSELPGRGVLLCLPQAGETPAVGLLLEAARTALADTATTHFVVVGSGGAGFARTLHLETPRLTVCVLDLPFDIQTAPGRVSAEIAAAEGYTEVHYDLQGRRYEPVLRPLELPAIEPVDLGTQDVLLVSGGGKGIASECALSFAREYGVSLILLGRSHPASDPELATNLERFAAAGVRYRYCACDVLDGDSVRSAVREAEAQLGAVTALLHSAGRNVPRLIAGLDAESFERTLAPKLTGLSNLLAAVDPQRLRLLVTFGSIIARSGMQGNADYATANEWLAILTERWAQQHPHCRCLAAEWSVWSGLGMGERLGRISALIEQGITPIPPQAGVQMLHQLVATAARPTAVVVAGRFGEPPTLKLEAKPLPFLRFLERPRVYYPDIELVVEADLTVASDPYLEDHIFASQRLFPAVMGLEAMAQAAMALSGSTGMPHFEQVEFRRPIVVPAEGSRTIRVVALQSEPGRVAVAIRSEDTGFGIDHFRAVCRFGIEVLPECALSAGEWIDQPALAVDPKSHLYGSILFHTGRFQRLQRYQYLRATECFAEIGPDLQSEWFSRLMPSQLLLGDPGARDTALHGIQACIPHAILLPVGVDRLVNLTGRPLAPHRSLFIHARERAREGNLFTYDLAIIDAEGQIQERWEGLRLQLMSGTEWRAAWPAPLLAPYIERRLQELNPGLPLAVAVHQDDGDSRRRRSDQAIFQASGAPGRILRRPDGAPEVLGFERSVSAAHAGPLTLAVASDEPVGCDIEIVTSRPPAVWLDLLGPERAALARLIAERLGGEDAAYTRVWAAVESLKKAGQPLTAPLTFVTAQADGWVVLAAGQLVVATFVAPVRELGGELALAVLSRQGAFLQESTTLACLKRALHKGDNR